MRATIRADIAEEVVRNRHGSMDSRIPTLGLFQTSTLKSVYNIPETMLYTKPPALKLDMSYSHTPRP